MKVSKECVDFVKRFEGFYSKPYYCPAGRLTLGYGLTGREIKGRTSITEEEASRELEQLLNEKYGKPVYIALEKEGIPIKQNEFDALVSFAYNIGVAGLLRGILFKAICAGERDPKKITELFARYNKAKVKGVYTPLKGLTRRRKQEAEMFLGDRAIKFDPVLSFQKYYNSIPGIKKKLVEDNIYGPKTESALKDLCKKVRGKQ